MPPGILNIVSNEAAERFSFYGMKSILVVFMTAHMRGDSGEPSPVSEANAREYYHAFTSAVYITPLGGALLAEALLGKYRTIVWLSTVYCAGHLALALNETRSGLAVGLALIALGSGGIKPCVSAHVGDQFGDMNQGLVSSTFAYFYLAINLGAFSSTLITPYLLEHAGSHVAFGVPGLAMALATLVFWMGRYSYAHVPAHGRRFCRQTCSREGGAALLKLFGLYSFFAVFWSLYDQTGSAWVLQARKMDRRFLGVEWLPSQISAINPLLILALVPLFHGLELTVPLWCRLATSICRIPPGHKLRLPGLYELVGTRCGVRVSPLRKIGLGLFLCAVAFIIPLRVEEWIEAAAARNGSSSSSSSSSNGSNGSSWGESPSPQPSIAWQLLSYFILTTSEILVSVTGLEFSYTQAPPQMKSMVMACYLSATSAGNLLTMFINISIQNDDGSMSWTDSEYYRFFVVLMLATAICFVPYAMCFKERRYVQPGQEVEERCPAALPREVTPRGVVGSVTELGSTVLETSRC